MPRDESEPEELWRSILARKENGSAQESDPRHARSNGSGPKSDSVLVDVLYNVLMDAHSVSAAGGADARSKLQEAIVASPVRSLPLQSRRRPLLQASGWRHTVLAAALLLITLFAIGYVVWYAMPKTCVDTTPRPTTPRTGPAGGPSESGKRSAPAL